MDIGFRKGLCPEGTRQGFSGDARRKWIFGGWVRSAFAVDSLKLPATIAPVPRKIRDLLKDYKMAGFRIVKGGKGDHRKLRHDKIPGAYIVDGKDGDDCKPYQEKDLLKAISSTKS